MLHGEDRSGWEAMRATLDHPLCRRTFAMTSSSARRLNRIRRSAARHSQTQSLLLRSFLDRPCDRVIERNSFLEMRVVERACSRVPVLLVLDDLVLRTGACGPLLVSAESMPQAEAASAVMKVVAQVCRLMPQAETGCDDAPGFVGPLLGPADVIEDAEHGATCKIDAAAVELKPLGKVDGQFIVRHYLVAPPI